MIFCLLSHSSPKVSVGLDFLSRVNDLLSRARLIWQLYPPHHSHHFQLFQYQRLTLVAK